MTMRFQPTFWATALALPMLIVLIVLGSWQVQRLEWKNELIETRAARILEPPLSSTHLAAAQQGWLGDRGLTQMEYLPVDLQGTYLGTTALRLLPRVRDGKQGYHLVSAFDAVGPLGTVLIDRGWVPLEIPVESLRPAAEPVRVEGFLRLFVEPGYFVPDNEPAANNWFFMHEGEMLAAANLSGPVGFYVQAGPNATPPGIYPVGSVPDVNLRNSHLEYAVTWYALAAVLVVIFVIFHWRREET